MRGGNLRKVKLSRECELWMKKQEDYTSFYRSLSNDMEGILSVRHVRVGDQFEFRAMRSVPTKLAFYRSGLIFLWASCFHRSGPIL